MFILRRLVPRAIRERIDNSLLKRTAKAPPTAPPMPQNTATDGPVATLPPQPPDTHTTAKAEITHVDSKDAIANLKNDEIVFVLPSKEGPSGGYTIYSLSENDPAAATNPSDNGKPFSLSATPAQLPEDSPLLTRFLVHPSAIPPSHLGSDAANANAKTRTHVVVSTRSGLGQAQAFYQGVLRPLLGALGLAESESESEGPGGWGGDGYRVTVTRDEDSIRAFARGLATADDGHGRREMVILLSGDGGVVDLLNGLDQAGASTTPTIALLPLGTGNALFHSLHKLHYASGASVPSPLVLGLRTLFKGQPTPLPVFRASFSPGARSVSSAEAASSGEPERTSEAQRRVDHLLGAIVASYGFHASLVWESDTPAYRVHGDKRFGMAAAELLKMAHAYDAQVAVRLRGSDEFVALHSTAEDSRASRFNYVLATMVSNLEKAFTISPASRPLDGRLRLVHFGDVGGEKTMEIMMAAYREGSHVGMAEVGYTEVEEVKVTIGEEDARWRKVCIDGSIVEVERGGWMKVGREQREWLRVLVDGYVTGTVPRL
ncbi:Sphingosine kinase 1 [Madurella mycetomatis]|uniref:Sphingosine kinase 1 n=1 Tax=Madurella mycetomatis TaxID=100816 RepID=A0A175VVK5_9PEZI|nr:Sphingosine kinase 1 [Madurella mycetomatis]